MESHKLNAKVLGAQYEIQSKSVVLFVETPNKRFYTQIHRNQLLPNITNLDELPQDPLTESLQSFCKIIIGRNMDVVFDEEIDNKIQEKIKIEY